MPRRAQLESLPQAYEVIKEMRDADGLGSWGEDVTAAARDALASVIHDRMALAIDRHLEEIARRGDADRRNGGYEGHILTGLGDIELWVPRTRTFSAKAVLGAYVRRTRDIDRMILSCFVLGLTFFVTLVVRHRLLAAALLVAFLVGLIVANFSVVPISMLPVTDLSSDE